MNVAALLAADTKPTATEVAEAFANDMARMIAALAEKFGKDDPAGFRPTEQLAARLSRLVAINLHQREAEARDVLLTLHSVIDAEDVLLTLHGVIEAENRAAWGLSVRAYEYAVDDFSSTCEMIADQMRDRVSAYEAAA